MQLWPSLLAADLLNLKDSLLILEKNDIHRLHLDVMDNHYVPNLSFGPDICRAIHEACPNMQLDVHLMISPLGDMIESFAENGAHRIAIHADSCTHLNLHLERIKQLGCQAGLAINPAEGIEHVQWSAHILDYILIMTVNPGFGGQSMLEFCLNKLPALKKSFPDLKIMLDGGVRLEHIPVLKKLAVDDVVVGSALFRAKNFPENIQEFKQALGSV